MRPATSLRPLFVAIVIALLGSLLVLGTTTPAASHITGSVKHLWSKHIKPKADKRYYTKTQADARYKPAVMDFGQVKSGTWSVSAPAGGMGTADITFEPPLPAAVTGHVLNPGATNSSCPGVGQAEPGHLCLYTSWDHRMTPYSATFYESTSSGSGVSVRGTVAYFTSSAAEGNRRGTWTVRAPLEGARPVPKQESVTPNAATD